MFRMQIFFTTIYTLVYIENAHIGEPYVIPMCLGFYVV